MVLYTTIVTKTLTIDKAGRVVIPKPLRKALHLDPGDSLTLNSSENEIVLRPVREKAHMHKERGIWVFRSGEPLKDFSIPEFIDKIREERSRDILG
jgi:AbrB family looped-hinge helix DNA binding protein